MNNSYARTPCPPGTAQAGGAGRGAAAACRPSPPKRHKQTQKGPASSSQPRLVPAPGTLTHLQTQAPGGRFTPKTKAKTGTVSLCPEHEPPTVGTTIQNSPQSIWGRTDRSTHPQRRGPMQAWDSHIETCLRPDAKVRVPGKPEGRDSDAFKSLVGSRHLQPLQSLRFL